VSAADWVLIDTGVWSAFFSKPGSREKRAVDALLDEDRVALTGPVLAEVLRGFRRTDQADLVASRLRLAIISSQTGKTGGTPQSLAASSQPAGTMFRLQTLWLRRWHGGSRRSCLA